MTLPGLIAARVLALAVLAAPTAADAVFVGRSGGSVEPGAASNGDLAAAIASSELGGRGGEDLQVLGFNEPTIAANPTDPRNLAIADLGLLRVSTDGGASFSFPVVAPLPFATHTFGGDPSLAFDSRGRLFWTYLGRRRDNQLLDVFVSQVNPATGAIRPGYPVNVSAAAGFPAGHFTRANDNDKEWLAADRYSTSPFRDRLYVTWTRFGAFFEGTVVHSSYSTDQGQSWSPALTLSDPVEGFVWPVHNAVGSDGSVYVAYHAGDDFDGSSARVFVLRSSDGGASFPMKTQAYAPGAADITFNVQFEGRTLDGSVSWTQGSAQPWVLPDPRRPGHVYVVAADDPTNTVHGGGADDMNVYLVRSTDGGSTWSDPVQIDSGPVGTTQFFPTGAIADDSGCLAVAWWDMRAGVTNEAGNLLLDFLVRGSTDGGIHFGPEIQVNDVPFDPDQGAPDRFPPSGTLRIGEYNGVAVTAATAHLVWTGNFAGAQAGFFDNATVCEIEVGLDVKPGSDSNPIQPSGRGVVPVALLGSESFDVADADPGTLVFGPDGAVPTGQPGVEDVNGDGFTDLVSHYRTQETGIAPGDTEACLEGATFAGLPLRGCDEVRIVGRARCGLGIELVLLAPLLARRCARLGRSARRGR
jgi:hypothetical protein